MSNGGIPTFFEGGDTVPPIWPKSGYLCHPSDPDTVPPIWAKSGYLCQGHQNPGCWIDSGPGRRNICVRQKPDTVPPILPKSVYLCQGGGDTDIPKTGFLGYLCQMAVVRHFSKGVTRFPQLRPNRDICVMTQFLRFWRNRDICVRPGFQPFLVGGDTDIRIPGNSGNLCHPLRIRSQNPGFVDHVEGSKHRVLKFFGNAASGR